MNIPEEEHIANYRLGEQSEASFVQEIREGKKSAETVEIGDNLDRVREIIFGSQMRNQEKRLNRMEERMIKECSTLRDETRKRLDSLETYFKKEIDLLAARLKSEKAEREETVEELAHELKGVIKSLEKKISQLDEQTTKTERNLLQQTLDLSKSLNDEIQHKSEEILAELERETKTIRKDKTNRSTLATLFTEMAMTLNKEFDT